MHQPPTLFAPCPTCGGRGVVARRTVDHTTVLVTCPDCHGTGAETETTRDE